MNTKSLHSPTFPVVFSQVQKSVPSVLSKTIKLVFLRLPNKSTQKKSAKHKNTSRDKIPKRCSTLASTTNNIEPKKDILASIKGSQLKKNQYSSIHKSIVLTYGAVFSRSCFFIQQKFYCPECYKAGTSKF